MASPTDRSKQEENQANTERAAKAWERYRETSPRRRKRR